MGQSRPLFVYFRSFHIPIQMTNINWRNPSERFDGRLVNLLHKDPIPDAGQWDMDVNVIEKYGENDQ